jgi:hypothetical protein
VSVDVKAVTRRPLFERRQSNRAVSHVFNQQSTSSSSSSSAAGPSSKPSPLSYPLQSVAEREGEDEGGNQSPSTTMAAVVVAREQIELYVPYIHLLVDTTIDTISSVL